MAQALSRTDLLDTLENVQALLESERTHIRLSTDLPIVLVGDTHGDVVTTRQVVETYLPDHQLVFCGDYVDRAPEPGGSIQTISYILEMKVNHPERVILLRGNHEFRRVFHDGGFGDALLEIDTADMSLTTSFEAAFAQLPYVATTENGILALHGGVPNIDHQEDLFNLPKGVFDFLTHQLISQTVNNENTSEPSGLGDPNDFVDSFRVHKPGFSLLYGESFLRDKLKLCGCSVLVRGHDYRVKGLSLNKRVVTLMTARLYADHGLMPGSLVARVDPQREISTAEDIELHTL